MWVNYLEFRRPKGRPKKSYEEIQEVGQFIIDQIYISMKKTGRASVEAEITVAMAKFNVSRSTAMAHYVFMRDYWEEYESFQIEHDNWKRQSG